MPFSFGNRSKEAFATCHADLQRVIVRALGFQVMDFAVLEGHRGKASQDAAYEAGNSQVQWPNGKHNNIPADAFDIAPFPIDWEDTERFVLLAGVMFAAASVEGVKIRWGGDWNMDGYQRDEKFRDWGHFELI